MAETGDDVRSVDVEGRAVARPKVERGHEHVVVGRRRDGRDPRAVVLDGRGAGPSLPADALTEIRVRIGVQEGQLDRVVNGSEPPLIEKLMTLTPSRIACWTAATESEWKQPWARQTR